MKASLGLPYSLRKKTMLHPSAFAKATPDKIAYRMAGSGACLTFRELEDASNRGAHLFRSVGLKAGDHIALMMENSLRFLEICWSAQRCGLYYTAISTHLTQDEIAYIVADCGAKVFVTSNAAADRAPSAKNFADAGVDIFICGAPREGFQSWDEAVARQPGTPVADEMGGFDMLYSSGTTGRPKGVKPRFPIEPLGDYSPNLQVLIRDMCGFDAQSVYLSPAPLYHAAPLAGLRSSWKNSMPKPISSSSRPIVRPTRSSSRPCSFACSNCRRRRVQNMIFRR
jgi:long-chain acyl-CoA synthetase